MTTKAKTMPKSKTKPKPSGIPKATTNPKGSGKPTKLTPEVQAKIVGAIAASNFFQMAGTLASVPRPATSGWSGERKKPAASITSFTALSRTMLSGFIKQRGIKTQAFLILIWLLQRPVSMLGRCAGGQLRFPAHRQR